MLVVSEILAFYSNKTLQRTTFKNEKYNYFVSHSIVNVDYVVCELLLDQRI